MWFVLDGDRIAFNTGAQTAKGKAMARDPRVVITVDLQEPPFAFVQVQGVVEVSEDLDEVRRIAAAAGARYMGVDRAASSVSATASSVSWPCGSTRRESLRRWTQLPDII